MKKDAARIIEELGTLVRGVWGHSENPEALSKDLNDISVLNWALGQWQAEYEEQERTMKTELDISKAKLLEEFVNAGDAVNRAEIKVTIQTAKQRKEYNHMASSLEKVKITIKANEKVMDAVRSRLSLIKGEIR